MIMSRAKGHAVLVIEFVLELEVSLYQPGLEGEWVWVGGTWTPTVLVWWPGMECKVVGQSDIILRIRRFLVIWSSCKLLGRWGLQSSAGTVWHNILSVFILLPPVTPQKSGVMLSQITYQYLLLTWVFIIYEWGIMYDEEVLIWNWERHQVSIKVEIIPAGLIRIYESWWRNPNASLNWRSERLGGVRRWTEFALLCISLCCFYCGPIEVVCLQVRL